METKTTKQVMGGVMKSHDTIVCGWDSNKNLVFVRTFAYKDNPKEQKLAQQAYEMCRDLCHHYSMGSIETFEVNEKPF